MCNPYRKSGGALTHTKGASGDGLFHLSKCACAVWYTYDSSGDVVLCRHTAKALLRTLMICLLGMLCFCSVSSPTKSGVWGRHCYHGTAVEACGPLTSTEDRYGPSMRYCCTWI